MSSSSDNKSSFLFPATRWNGLPKSPKSPKVLTVENPLLKRPQFMLGAAHTASTMRSDGGSQSQPRSPLTPLSINRAQPANKTPGPPPKASLSLMSMSVAPPNVNDAATASGFRQSDFINSRDGIPITPPPMSSPRLLQQSQTMSIPKIEFSSGDSGNWIVSYGYASREEYNELEQILASYGSIISSQANANWLAIKYESQLAAEKALCSQPIKLTSNSLCGTVRGSAQLLQTLRAQQPNCYLKSAECALNNPLSEDKARTYADSEPLLLSEEDILAPYHTQDEYDHDWGHSDSICEKILAWFFGWNKVTSQKPHID